MRRKLLPVLLLSVIILFTGCEKDKPSEGNNSPHSSAQTTAISTSHSHEEDDDEIITETNKTGMWAFLPEIPETDVSAFKYRLNDSGDGIIITDFVTDEKQIRIPDKIDGKPVVSLSLNEEFDKFFVEDPIVFSYDEVPDYRRYEITELILPDTVKQIISPSLSGYEFRSYDAPALNKVEYMNFPSELEYCNCELVSLKTLYLNDGTSVMPKMYHTYGVSLPDNIEELYIPDSVRAFGKEAVSHYDRNTLQYVLNDSLKKIYYDGKTFDGYSDELHTLINDINGDGMCILERTFGNTKSVHLLDFFSDREEIVIPDGVTSVYITGLQNVKSLTIPASVEELESIFGTVCFDNFSSLTAVKFEEGSKLKIFCGFNNCTSLKSIEIPEGVTAIGEFDSYTMHNCTSLESLNIPDGVVSISENCFCGCTGLKTVSIPSSVTTVGRGVFKDSSKISEITLGDDISLEIEWEEVFAACKDNPNLVIKYKGREFNSFEQFRNAANLGDMTLVDQGFVIEYNSLVQYTGNNNHVVVPDCVTSIKFDAFEDCTDFRTISIGSQVTLIEGMPLMYNSTRAPLSNYPTLTWVDVAQDNQNYCSVNGMLCSKTQDEIILSTCPRAMTGSVEVPPRITTIGGSAFQGCTELTDVWLHDDVKLNGEFTGRDPNTFEAHYSYSAFYGCENITVHYKGETYDYEHIDDFYNLFNE